MLSFKSRIFSPHFVVTSIIRLSGKRNWRRWWTISAYDPQLSLWERKMVILVKTAMGIALGILKMLVTQAIVESIGTLSTLGLASKRRSKRTAIIWVLGSGRCSWWLEHYCDRPRWFIVVSVGGAACVRELEEKSRGGNVFVHNVCKVFNRRRIES